MATPRKDPALKKKAGRPLDSSTVYTPALAAEINQRIAQGETLASILKDPGMPSREAVCNWVVVDLNGFGKEYIHAREIGQDVIAEDTLRIIDELPDMEPVLDRDGNVVKMQLHSAYVQWARNRVDQRMRLLKAWNPRKYGDRQVVAGDPDAPLKVEVTAVNLIALAGALEGIKQIEAEDTDGS